MENPSTNSLVTPASFVMPCSTCHKPDSVHKHGPFRNCLPCRENNRRKSELKQQRKKQREEEIARARISLQEKMDSGAMPNENFHGGHQVTSTGATKRKSPKGLHELDGEAQRVALGQMKNGLKQAVKGNKRVVSLASLRVVTTSGEGKEYQSASALYDSLKNRLKKVNPASAKFLKFHGFHSIIAVSTIDNQKRAAMVANDLRKIARVPFDLSKPTPSYNFETMGRTLTFKCTCLGNTPAAVPNSSVPTTATPTAILKGTQGDLIRQARARAGVEAAASSVPRVCGGTILITAVDDGRHPLGILGQRISVCIEHPSKSK
ncbi:hypothetical protein GALMADRAFT_213720 [Galerina marginata CBS 339.88]|uniref:Uncharacterized protein n=1 Tax=Galerina marginata (strain CBS 339.88) TaxID=685588 RepID=A0A067SLS8_GALM3|nr:hypothetical protein GALMADRAFT_213720 [Galerina marginata CBS 339.88]